MDRGHAQELIRQVLPAYEVKELLGVGSFGSVFRIKDSLKERAVKIVLLSAAPSLHQGRLEPASARIDRDFQHIVDNYDKIACDEIVTVYDFYKVTCERRSNQETAYAVIVMELYPANLLEYLMDYFRKFQRAVDVETATILLEKTARPGGIPLLMRVGINTGSGIVESNDLFGDAVNVASRFETLAEPGEILISESTCEALGANREEYFVRLKMTTGLKEKSGLFKAFKVCLSPEEFAEAAPAAEIAVVGHSRRGTDRLPAAPIPAPVPGPLAEIGRTLQARLEREQPLGTNFSGKSALWFHKTSIILGRTPDADFPLSNQAISRVPLKFGIARDGGVLSVPARGAAFKPVEIEQNGERTPVTPDTEFPLGHQGRVILAGCFPIEYHVYEGRFLILRIVDPAQELRRVYAGPLRDIWRGFDNESKH